MSILNSGNHTGCSSISPGLSMKAVMRVCKQNGPHAESLAREENGFRNGKCLSFRGSASTSKRHTFQCNATPERSLSLETAPPSSPKPPTPLRAPGSELQLSTCPQATHKTGLDVWEGARALARHLLQEPALVGEGTRVLEVGAGTGFVGLSLARAGAEVCLTDGSQEVLSLLAENVQANAHAFAHVPTVRQLRWGVAEDLEHVAGEHYDVVIASECVYGDSAGTMCSNLITTLKYLCKDERTQLVLSYTIRPIRISASEYVCPLSYREVPFFAQAAADFTIREVKQKKRPGSAGVNDPILLTMIRRPEPEKPLPAISHLDRSSKNQGWRRWIWQLGKRF